MSTNEVTFIPAQCTNCNAALDFEPNADRAVCPYCGSVYIIQKPKEESQKGVIQSYLEYKRDKEERLAQKEREDAERAERQRREEAERNERLQREEAERLERKRQEEEAQREQSKKTALWVLGWIFIFPVPLTILMLRNKTLESKIRYGIIAAGWIAYLLIVFVNPTGTPEPSRSTPPAATTAYSTTLRTTTQTKRTTTTRITTTATTADTTDLTTETTESTQPIETTTTAVTRSDAEIMAAVKNGDYSLVTPEFKQTMDAYEAFYDDYITFMKRYESGEGDIMGMLNDYLSMMEKLEQWSAKIDAIDEKTLSPADDAYYLLVTLRVEQKLLGVVW